MHAFFASEKVCFLFFFSESDFVLEMKSASDPRWEGARGIVMCLQNFRNETGMPLFGEPCLFGEPVEHAETSGKATSDPRVHWELHRIIETILVGALGIVCGVATSTVFNSFEKHGLLQYENNVVRDSILQETLTVRGSLFEVGHDLSDGRKNKLHNSNN